MNPVYFFLGAGNTVLTTSQPEKFTMTPGEFIQIYPQQTGKVMAILKEEADNLGHVDAKITFDNYGNPIIVTKEERKKEKSDRRQQELEAIRNQQELAADQRQQELEAIRIQQELEAIRNQQELEADRRQQEKRLRELETKELIERIQHLEKRLEETRTAKKNLQDIFEDSQKQIQELLDTIRDLEKKVAEMHDMTYKKSRSEQINKSVKNLFEDLWSYEQVAYLILNLGMSLDPTPGPDMDKRISYQKAVDIAKNFYEKGAFVPNLSGLTKNKGHGHSFNIETSKLKKCACCSKPLGKGDTVRLFYMSSSPQHCGVCDTPSGRVVCAKCLDVVDRILREVAELAKSS